MCISASNWQHRPDRLNSTMAITVNGTYNDGAICSTGCSDLAPLLPLTLLCVQFSVPYHFTGCCIGAGSLVLNNPLDSASAYLRTFLLAGGPGCSGMLAMLMENGPYTVNNVTNELELNPYSWTNHANVIWVDQPVGTGYSYADSTFDYVVDEKQVPHPPSTNAPRTN